RLGSSSTIRTRMRLFPYRPAGSCLERDSTRAKLNGCLNGTTGKLRGNVNRYSERSLVARAPDDASLAVDVDPDHAAVLNELEACRVAVELRAEVIGAAHERNHPALQLRKGH